MQFRYLLFASLALATVAAHAADSKGPADARPTTVTVAEPQLATAPLFGPRLGLLEAQKANPLAQQNAAALANAAAVDGAGHTLATAQRSIAARPDAPKSLSLDNNEAVSSPSVAWPLLLGLLLVFLRRTPQRFRSNGL